MRTPFPLLLILIVAGCSRGTPPAVEAPAGPAQEGTLHVLSLNRLQGFAEAIPCSPADIAVLPAAMELRDRLRAGGDTAVLVAIGDAVNRSYKGGHGKAADIAIRARSLNVLEALAAAKVDAYVPSHGDFAIGIDDLLDECSRLGIPVLLSNLSSNAHRDIKPWLVLQAGTLKVGCLGVIPAKVGESEPADEAAPGEKPAPVDASYPGVTMLPVTETVQRLADELRREQGVDLVVVFSSVSEKANSALSHIESVDLVIGTQESSMIADHIVLDGKTARMSSGTAGREAGHTTLAVRRGNLQFADMSPMHSMPAQIAQGEKRLKDYQDKYQTTDTALLARYVAPDDEQSFLNFVQMLDENREFLRTHQAYDDSYIDHRAATLAAPQPGNPVSAVLAGQGQAIETALAGAKLRPPAPLEGNQVIPQPEDCKSCHEAQYKFWAATPHAKAYEGVQRLHRARDVSCLECHTTGFEVPYGWADPRFDAPFGSVTCYQCHNVLAPHSSNPRQVVDPQFAYSDVESMKCEVCHVARRSPGFDKATDLPKVACPPMRNDEPALLLARQHALEIIGNRRAKGTGEPRDEYLEGRAQLGLGDFEKGYATLTHYALSQPDDGALQVEIARLFEQTGSSKGALKLLGDYLERRTGDPVANKEYLTLLLFARDEGVRDPEAALTRLKFLLPDDPAESHKANLDFRVLQIDALFLTGRQQEGLAVINELAREHGEDPRLKERIRRYLGR